MSCSESKKILIVDDNCQASMFIRDLLELSGFESVAANSGQEALEIVNEHNVDLVLLDVMMPDMNGILVAKKIKEISGNEFLPVILVTALSNAEDKIAGLEFADDYITKPFSGDELLAHIKSLLRIRKLHYELSQSKKRYESLCENFPHLYISIDSQRNISDCNQFFRQTFNVSKEEIIGKSIYTFFKQEDHDTLEDFFNSFIISDVLSVQQRNFQLIKPNTNETITVNLRAVYVGCTGNELSIVIAMEDITCKLRMEEEQKIARKHLFRSAKLASVGTLASGVAHEINNPLTAILGFSNVLIDRLKHDETVGRDEMLEYLQIINDESLRCRDIVEKLSKFAREGEVVLYNVALCECINDAIKLTNSQTVKAGITVTNNIPQTVQVFADANKLEQVFVNVLTNCADFCQENASVEISPFKSRDPSKYYALQISDNGPGIDAETLPKVFDPFFTTKGVGQGTGMGLAISHKIMEESNGIIDITSELKKGTSIILEIPFVKMNETEQH
ncbi:MAG: response regulator [Fibrobacter sp.]|nr:response regulator [Fibrobacter sp.]